MSAPSPENLTAPVLLATVREARGFRSMLVLLGLVLGLTTLGWVLGASYLGWSPVPAALVEMFRLAFFTWLAFAALSALISHAIHTAARIGAETIQVLCTAVAASLEQDETPTAPPTAGGSIAYLADALTRTRPKGPSAR